MKEKAFRETKIRNVHEMGEMKRAQELRVDDFSVQKLRASHETIHKLTSQLQEMQEQINSLSDSGHDKKWNQFLLKMFTRSQSTRKDSKSAIYAALRQTLAT